MPQNAWRLLQFFRPHWVPPLWQWVVVLLGGTVLGALFDQIHVQCQILAYAHADFLAQAWWVGPQFGLAALLMFLQSQGPALFAVAQQPLEPTRGQLLQSWLWFLGAYGASGLLSQWPMALTAGYGLTWLWRTARQPERRVLWLHGAGLALVGCTYEHLLASTGAFHYLHPGLGQVPWWLAGIYLHGAPVALWTTRRLRPAGLVLLQPLSGQRTGR